MTELETTDPHTKDKSSETQQGLLKSGAIVSSMTMLSRMLGLLRDIVIAVFIGASANADAFFIAFKVPQFLRRLFAEGAFSQAFVPVLAEYKEAGSAQALQLLLNRVSGVLGGSLLLVTSIMVIGAPLITVVFAPGFVSDPIKYSLTSDMIRITFPYLFLISMTGFCGAVLNSYGRFAVPAFTPIWLNISLIVAAVWVSPQLDEPVFALAWAVLVAGLVQLCFQLPFLARMQLLPRPVWHTEDEGVQQIMRLMVPALFGVSVSQLNLMLDTIIASFLPTGSVSWLYYSDRLMELPLGVFGIAIATVLLPNLSRFQANASETEFAETLDWGLRSILLIAFPATAALIMLAEPILLTLFQYGALTVTDVSMTVLSLRAYTVGLIAFMLIKVLAPGYYARKDMKTPVKIGIKAMVANMVLNILLVIPFYYYWNIGHVGLALATSMAAFLNAGLLFSGLYRQGIYKFQLGWGRLVLQLLIATAGMVVLLWSLQVDSVLWLSWGWQRRTLELGLLCVSGMASYLIILWMAGVRVSDFYTGSASQRQDS